MWNGPLDQFEKRKIDLNWYVKMIQNNYLYRRVFKMTTETVETVQTKDIQINVLLRKCKKMIKRSFNVSYSIG